MSSLSVAVRFLLISSAALAQQHGNFTVIGDGAHGRPGDARLVARASMAFPSGGATYLIMPAGSASPALSVSKTHTGDFAPGQSAAAYTVTVSNAASAGPTSGTVTVTESLPSGLTLVSMAGSGWTCAAPTLSCRPEYPAPDLPPIGWTCASPTTACSRSDILAPGASYPAITVTVNVAGNALSPQVNLVTVSGGGSATASMTDSAAVVAKFVVGDVYSYTSDAAQSFGDGLLDIRDLILELFAVNSIPGYRPAACSDRFDAMDLYPADNGTTRGGDGLLDIRDLILELFRVNNLDLARPVRESRGGVCGSSGTAGSTRLDAVRRAAAPPANREPAAGSLAVGLAERQADGSERAPVYLSAAQDLTRVAVTFGLGDGRSQLQFTPAAGATPSLLEERSLGVVAAAWLDGVSVQAGGRLLLGYVAGPSGTLANIEIYGVSASGLDDNREVRLEAKAAR